jgi:hypothetical protein
MDLTAPVYAGDGGPTQPEVHSFEPVGTNQMVDLFTGDFTYNIPLFNLPGPDGGYPINLAYHSGVQMDQEASWVGLGWNINMGTINRQIRNLPDDFGGGNEENVTIKTDMRPNWTVGVGAGATWEIFGLDTKKLNPTGELSPNLNLYYNNYRGIGYTAEIGFNLNLGKDKESGDTKISGDLGFNIKLDSQEGIGGSLYADVVREEDKKTTATLGVSTGFNNRTGWQRSLNISTQTKRAQATKNFRVSAASGGSTISFSRPMVQLQVPNAMRGSNGSISFAKGTNSTGSFKKWSTDIFFNFSTLKDRNKSINYKGIGYLYYQQAPDSGFTPENDRRVKDMTRENDGLVHKDTRRLGTPTLSYDIYSVTGQGIGNMFRPVRAEIATATPVHVESKYYGGNAGLEVGFTANRTGLDIGFQYSGNQTSQWPNANAAGYSWQTTDASLTKSVYFKNYGELSSDEIAANYGASVASEQPVAYGLRAADNFYDITNIDQNTNGNTIQIQTTRAARRKRSIGVEAFTNGMIMDGSSSLIPEFDLMYYGAPATSTGNGGYNKLLNRTDYDGVRAALSKTQVGGYATTNDQGMRYVYGLPAQNNLERDVTFSVKEAAEDVNTSHIGTIAQSGGGIDYKQKGTDKYYQSIEKKSYAHSYLLTSILGTDYADVDGVAGPSDGDMGYWVRFDYTRAHSGYNWRAPYDGAMYDKGYATSFTDGKGRYSYGSKEIWYVATVETKTHIAEFILGPRDDGKSSADELGGGAATSNGYYRLVRIDVYAKSERYPNGTFNGSAKPVQSCHFTYDYSLCTDTPDNTVNDGGKLTLKSFYFTYRNNQTGATTPYVFDYNTSVDAEVVGYDRYSVDRWGNYQPGGTDNVDYPYIDPYTSKEAMDERAALWNLKAINLPSGGRYEIDYESDSYAYVQDEVAMQMFPIASMEPYADINGELIEPTTAIQHPANADEEHRRVYFKLEQPIPLSTGATERDKLMQKYIRPGEYLYFKVKINMTKSNGSTEYVGAYAKVTDIKVDESSDVSGNWIWGYVTLDFLKVNGQNTSFHPFTEAGSRHIRYSQPQLLYDNAAKANLEKLSKSDIKAMGTSLVANAKDIVTTFTGFTAHLYGNGNDRLSDIEVEKSYLRLRTPDKIKYGGGHRVKEIRVIDNWAASTLSAEASSTYGTVYEYDMTDENGNTISSGVAAYEPMVGGDEIPLRNPVAGWEDKNIASKSLAQTYTEEPGNESLFPGPTVGYRQVKVMSKNTATKKNSPDTNPAAHYGGITVHEFYTAKDYPVITKNTELETDKTFRKSRLVVPALIVNVDRLRMAATQGYYIELNDMHGKPKGARELAFNAAGDEQEISSVQYDYFDEAQLTTNRAGETFETRKLKNDVDVLYNDIDAADLTQSDIRTTTLATEVEFIPETRYQQSRNISAGLQLNFETGPPFIMFFPIPTFNWQEEKTGTVVTNKIVNKAGIVQKVTAVQRGSVAETENLVFDDITGVPLLTSVTNDYGNKVYNYSILARGVYDGTGAAYRNIGYSAVGTVPPASGGTQLVTLNTPAEASGFVPGDVLLAIPVMLSNGQYVDDTQQPLRSKKICTYQIQELSSSKLLVEASGLSGLYRFTVIRSGRRNQLTVPVSSITALSNPTEGRQTIQCTDNAHLEVPQSYNLYTIDKVLAINAVELGDKWYKDTRQLGTVPGSWYDNAFYAKGFGGSFSPVRSYAYVDNRKQSIPVDLEDDGVFENRVPLFNWDRLQATPNSESCLTKWREVDRITLKNPSSFDIETRNILGVYSAQLYGRGGTEPIAVAGNARNTEIGSENFEEYANGGLDFTQNASNNLNFYSTVAAGTRYVEDRYDFKVLSPNLATLTIPAHMLSYYSGNTHGYALRIHFDGYTPTGLPAVPAQEVLVRPTSFTLNAVNFQLPATNVPYGNSRRGRGELFAKRQLPNPAANTGVSVVSTVAHTGDKCLAVSNTAGATFVQPRLTLDPGQEYQFSGWFRSPDNAYLLKNHSTELMEGFTVRFFKANGDPAGLIPYSEAEAFQGGFIDDWQKFTLNFTMPADAIYFSVELPCAQSTTSGQIAYYDDLRVQPRDAGMTTYVYNQQNQRLEAQLDDNNYATFYYYDDEGNLFLVKRETEKGIITVQESRTYMRKQ